MDDTVRALPCEISIKKPVSWGIEARMRQPAFEKSAVGTKRVRHVFNNLSCSIYLNKSKY